MAYAIVQSQNFSNARTSAQSATVTPGATLTAGNGALLTVKYCTNVGSAIAVSTVKDQAGNALTYTEVASPGVYNPGTEFGTHLLWVYNLGSGITAVTVTLSANANLGISLLLEEVSGLQKTSAALIASSSSNTTATLAANNINSGTTGTLSTQPAMVYAILIDDSRSNHAPTAGSGFTAGVVFAHPINVSGHSDNSSENQRVTATTGVAATGTNIGASGDTCPCIMAVIAETAITGVTITSVTPSTFYPGESGVVIAGTGFSGSGNTVALIDTNGISSAQTLTAQSTTSITFTCAQGNVRYGAATLQVTNGASQSATSAVTLSTASGVSFVNLATPRALTYTTQVGGQPTPSRLYDTPTDIPAGAQVEYQVSSGSGTLTVATDGTVSWATTVKQKSWRWIAASGGTWTTLYNWALVGLFPGFIGSNVLTQTFTQNTAISALNFTPLFTEPESAETPLTYSLASGTWPTGLALNATSGQLTGTPTATGTQSGLIVQATNPDSSYAQTNSFSIVVSAASQVQFSGLVPSTTFTVGMPASLAMAPFFSSATSYGVTSGTLPAGLSISASTGLISGTPTGAGASSVTIQVTGSNAVPSSAVTNSFVLSIVVIVPIVLGDPSAVAIAACTSAGLVVTVQTVFSPGAQAGVVIAQSLTGNSSGTFGEAITLQVTQGVDISSAIQAVVQAGLIPQVQYAANASVPAGYVISQNPAAGTPVPINSPVVLVDSTGYGGPVGMTTVPNVQGLRWDTAVQQLQASSISLDKYIWQANAATAGTVLLQSLAVGTQVAPGAIVQLTLSAGPTKVPGMVTVPQAS